MSNPSIKELQDSIEELQAYRDRLRKEVSKIGQKLNMPQEKQASMLKESFELNHIESILSKLIRQRDRYTTSNSK